MQINLPAIGYLVLLNTFWKNGKFTTKFEITLHNHLAQPVYAIRCSIFIILLVQVYSLHIYVSHN